MGTQTKLRWLSESEFEPLRYFLSQNIRCRNFFKKRNILSFRNSTGTRRSLHSLPPRASSSSAGIPFWKYSKHNITKLIFLSIFGGNKLTSPFWQRPVASCSSRPRRRARGGPSRRSRTWGYLRKILEKWGICVGKLFKIHLGRFSRCLSVPWSSRTWGKERIH